LSGSTGDSKTYCKEIGCEDVDWINFAEDEVQWQALKKIIISLWVP
jgi:hypothetical protein